MKYEMPTTITPPWTQVPGAKPRAFVTGPHVLAEDGGRIVCRYAMRDESGTWRSIHMTYEAAIEARDAYNA